MCLLWYAGASSRSGRSRQFFVHRQRGGRGIFVFLRSLCRTWRRRFDWFCHQTILRPHAAFEDTPSLQAAGGHGGWSWLKPNTPGQVLQWKRCPLCGEGQGFVFRVRREIFLTYFVINNKFSLNITIEMFFVKRDCLLIPHSPFCRKFYEFGRFFLLHSRAFVQSAATVLLSC